MNSLAPAIAAVLSIVGALLLALSGPGANASIARAAAWAWPIWTASNAIWIVYGWRNEAWPIVAQMGVLLVTSLIGCWQWLLSPIVDRLLDRALGLADEGPVPVDGAYPAGWWTH